MCKVFCSTFSALTLEPLHCLHLISSLFASWFTACRGTLAIAVGCFSNCHPWRVVARIILRMAASDFAKQIHPVWPSIYPSDSGRRNCNPDSIHWVSEGLYLTVLCVGGNWSSDLGEVELRSILHACETRRKRERSIELLFRQLSK